MTRTVAVTADRYPVLSPSRTVYAYHSVVRPVRVPQEAVLCDCVRSRLSPMQVRYFATMYTSSVHRKCTLQTYTVLRMFFPVRVLCILCYPCTVSIVHCTESLFVRWLCTLSTHPDGTRSSRCAVLAGQMEVWDLDLVNAG